MSTESGPSLWRKATQQYLHKKTLLPNAVCALKDFLKSGAGSAALELIEATEAKTLTVSMASTRPGEDILLVLDALGNLHRIRRYRDTKTEDLVSSHLEISAEDAVRLFCEYPFSQPAHQLLSEIKRALDRLANQLLDQA